MLNLITHCSQVLTEVYETLLPNLLERDIFLYSLYFIDSLVLFCKYICCIIVTGKSVKWLTTGWMVGVKILIVTLRFPLLCNVKVDSGPDWASYTKVIVNRKRTDFQRTTQCYIPENSVPFNYQCENIEFRLDWIIPLISLRAPCCKHFPKLLGKGDTLLHFRYFFLDLEPVYCILFMVLLK
jgi:hypothetical protein